MVGGGLAGSSDVEDVVPPGFPPGFLSVKVLKNHAILLNPPIKNYNEIETKQFQQKCYYKEGHHEC